MSNSPFVVPPPGLDGTYVGSCTICLRGTDTALGFRGDAEFVIAGLVTLGIDSMEEADATLRSLTGCDDGMVPTGVLSQVVRVCAECVDKCPAAFPAPVPLMMGAEVPCIEHSGQG